MAYPSPEPDELVLFSEITLIGIDDAAALIVSGSEAVANARWNKTLEDLESWEDVSSDDSDIEQVGSIKFFEGTSGSKVLDFRNKLRARYGLPFINQSGASVKGSRSGSKTINFVF